MDPLIRRLLKGSGLVAINQLLASAIGFIVTVIVARHYGASILGLTASISSAVTLFSLVSLMGTDTYSLRIFGKGVKSNLIFPVYFKLLIVCLVGTLFFISVYNILQYISGLHLAGSIEEYSPFIAALVVIVVIQKLNIGVLRGCGDVFFFSTIDLVSAVFLFIAVGVAFVLNAEGATIPFWYSASYIGGFFYSIYALRKSNLLGTARQSPEVVEQVPNYKLILKSSIPMLGTTLSFTIITTSDILTLNYFVSEAQVGIYAVYVRLLLAITLISTSANSILAPQVSRLYHQGLKTKLEVYSRRATFIVFTLSTMSALFMTILSDLILGIFGDIYLTEKRILFILFTSCLVNAFFGATGFFLNMTGHERQFFQIMAGAALLNMALNLMLVPKYGLMGAAISTLFTVFSWNVLATIVIWKKFGHTLLLKNGVLG